MLGHVDGGLSACQFRGLAGRAVAWLEVVSAGIWRLRIFQREGLEAEALAEIEGGGIEGEAAEVGPEVKLAAGSLTTEALEEIAADVDREATLLVVGDAV